MYDTDGAMFANSWLRFAEISDGLSNTTFMAESILGSGVADTTTVPTGNDLPRAYRAYTGSSSAPMTDSACDSSGTFRFTRGYAWADGGVSNGTYNHYYRPNDAIPDCLGRSSPGWKAARSWHAGGVQCLMGDGSVHFMLNEIDLDTWRAVGTRAGYEVASDY